ncbi:sugar transferase [uncultured Maribacter sp.]|uniref:sugar transferase n=1 Tax=uncultured Maribacter sp. TaxID=431308 RepID=UPI00260CB939|nr:sugar transferase [uncultured Maribacter sp.]
MIKTPILNSIERKFILFVGDLIVVLTKLNVLINHSIDREFISVKLKISLFLIGVITYFSLAYILDFYNLEKVSKRKYLFSQSVYISVLFVFIVFILSVLIFDVSFWRKPLLYFLLLTPLEIFLWRLFFRNVFKIIPTTKNVLYIYEEKSKNDLKNDVEVIDGFDMETFYKVKLSYCINENNLITNKFFTATDKIDTWIINTKGYSNFPQKLENRLLHSILEGKEAISYTSFYENVYEALPIKSHNDSFFEILQLQNRRIRYLHKVFSFLINFILSLFVGSIFLFCAPFVWILNLFFNKGPLFYTQKRVGQFGREFNIYKFRSMVVDAEKFGAKMAAKNDARITEFGKILRKFRIDELPQIISVIKGDMQFIGPRPERKVFTEKLNEITPFYNIRHLIRPGITGWAQVKFKYGETLEDSIQKLEYDLYYIKNKSINLDLRVIFKTVTTVLFSRGI